MNLLGILYCNNCRDALVSAKLRGELWITFPRNFFNPQSLPVTVRSDQRSE